MAGRLIAIGDIHGCSKALAGVVAAVDPGPADTIVALGDYIDRGPDSRGVLAQLIALAPRCRLVPILGNHDEMLLNILDGHRYLLADWLAFGGDATLASYEGALPEEIPREHVAFLRECRSWHESDRHIFVHASYDARKPLSKQPPELLRWEILDLGYLKCIDTCVYGDGWLTALDVRSGQVWQADKEGRMSQEGAARETP
jgi:serine/threonine protein phosphatase 1